MKPGARLTRRSFLVATGAMATLGALSSDPLAAVATDTPLHGLSAFGTLKYGPDFRQFEYAAPDAPQGGVFAFQPPNWLYNQSTQTFNTLNCFVLQGDAPPRMELCFDTLMVRALDEPDSLYCALARSVTISADRNRVRFDLKPHARFHDGSPILASDVAFSLLLLKDKGHPDLALDLLHLRSAEAAGDHVVELVFDGRQSRRAIHSIGESAPVFSRASLAGKEFPASDLAALAGSGPWRVGRFEAGQFIEYERVRDWWGRDEPFARGLDHFDRIRIDFYSESQAAFEAFKKGEIVWRQEFTSRAWARDYDFPAVKQGRVRRSLFAGEKQPSLQAFALNMRRARFADARTRAAIAMLFDFEWTNKNLFFGAYERSHSLFARSEFDAGGMPSPAELALLEPLRSLVPPETFGPAVRQPASDGSGADRAQLRQAAALLEAAGWQRKDGRLFNAAGEALEIEMLIDSQVFERVLGPFTENLRRLGIVANLRLADAAQYQKRLESFDFDMAMFAFSLESNPTEESLRLFFHSSSAEREGTNNYPGIADPAVDALIAAAGQAESREALVAAMRALDRVLRARHFWIPNWHSANHRVAHWDMFGWRDPKPDYGFPVERLWWLDRQRAQAIGKG